MLPTAMWTLPPPRTQTPSTWRVLPAYDTTLQSKSADTSLASTVDAQISADANVTGNNVNVQAQDTGTIFVLAIAMTIKGGGFGFCANLTTTEAGDTVTAYTDDSTVIATSGTIDLTATAVQNIQTYGIGSAAALGGKFAGAGSYVSTEIENTIEAYVMGGTVKAQDGVTISAGDSNDGNQTTINSVAGGAAGTLGDVAVGAAVTNNTLEEHDQDLHRRSRGHQPDRERRCERRLRPETQHGRPGARASRQLCLGRLGNNQRGSQHRRFCDRRRRHGNGGRVGGRNRRRYADA